MFIAKKNVTTKSNGYLINILKDANATSEQIDYLIGCLEFELEVTQRSMASGDCDYFQPSHLHLNDYILVIQNYNELINTLAIFKNYFEQMTNDNLKGGD